MTPVRRGRPPLPPGTHGAVRPKKEGRRWRCKVGYRDLNGGYHEFTAKGDSKQECLNHAALRWVAIESELKLEAGRATTSMRWVAERWLEFIERQVDVGTLASGTLTQYRKSWKGTLAPLLDDLDVNELTRRQVQSLLYDGLFRRNHRGEYIEDEQGQRVPLVGTQARQVLRLVLDFAADRGYRHDGLSPLYGTTAPHKALREKRISRVVTDTEWKQLLEMSRAAAARPRASAHLHRLLVLVYYTGARTGEAVGLTIGKIDVASDPPSVVIDEKLPESYRVSDRNPLEPTKGKERRVVIAAPELHMMLLEALQGRDSSGPKAPLIATRNGTFVTHANVRTMLRDLVRGTDLEWVHPHALRRTYLTAAEKLYGLEAAAQLAGHNDERTTLRHYIVKDGLIVLDPRAIFAREHVGAAEFSADPKVLRAEGP